MSINESQSNYSSFVFFGSMRESVEALSEEQGNKLLRAIMLYGTEGIIENDDPAIKSIILSIKPNIDNSHLQHEKAVERHNLWEKKTKEKMQKRIDEIATQRTNEIIQKKKSEECHYIR